MCRGANLDIPIDKDITHIARVVRPSLCGFRGDPILPPGYWRMRLHRLLDSAHLTKAQLCSIDGLLLQLDAFEAGQHAERGVSEVPLIQRRTSSCSFRHPQR